MTVKKKKPAKTETDIQSKIRVALSDYGVVFRTNSGEFWQGKVVYSKEFHQNVLIDLRRVQGLPKGFPDLIFFGFDGIPAFIEVKKPKKNRTPEQENFAQLMQSYGYRIGVARSDDEALNIINYAGNPADMEEI